jgi:hypothetical protein
MKDAMLFAWADNKSLQQEIITLKLRKIFLGLLIIEEMLFLLLISLMLWRQKTRIINSGLRTRLYMWLTSLRSGHKAVLSSSANNYTLLNDVQKQTNTKFIKVYGGLTEVRFRLIKGHF